uniref:FATC domain-containing protein n=1 Tax=Angiostrongylus cantonensis TaxID=6313 RepID=A0A0K0CXN0_ANGCA
MTSIGDRHGENILVDVVEGCVVHVDFNLIFHKGEYLPVREVIQTFVHDPLLEWINTEARAQQKRGRCEQKINAPSAESVQLILKRLEGHIVSPEVYKHKFSCAPMSLEGQVAKLIDIASDEKNLAQMYIGWGPFI